MTPITPIGTRCLLMRKPFGNVRPSNDSPTGSGSATKERTSDAIPSRRASVSSKRSIRCSSKPAARPSSMSLLLALRMTAWRSIMDSAMAIRVSFLTFVLSVRNRRETWRARVPTSFTSSYMGIFSLPIMNLFCLGLFTASQQHHIVAMDNSRAVRAVQDVCDFVRVTASNGGQLLRTVEGDASGDLGASG